MGLFPRDPGVVAGNRHRYGQPYHQISFYLRTFWLMHPRWIGDCYQRDTDSLPCSAIVYRVCFGTEDKQQDLSDVSATVINSWLKWLISMTDVRAQGLVQCHEKSTSHSYTVTIVSFGISMIAESANIIVTLIVMRRIRQAPLRQEPPTLSMRLSKISE